MAPSPMFKALVRLLLTFPALCMALPTPSGSTEVHMGIVDHDFTEGGTVNVVPWPETNAKRFALTAENLAALDSRNAEGGLGLPGGANVAVNPAALPAPTEIHSLGDLESINLEGDHFWDFMRQGKNQRRGEENAKAKSLLSSAKSGCSDEGGCSKYVDCLKDFSPDNCFRYLPPDVQQIQPRKEPDTWSKAKSILSSAASGCSDEGGCPEYVDCLKNGAGNRDDCMQFIPGEVLPHIARGEKEEPSKHEVKSRISSAKSGCSDEGGCPQYVDCLKNGAGSENECAGYLPASIYERAALSAEDQARQLWALRQESDQA